MLEFSSSKKVVTSLGGENHLNIQLKDLGLHENGIFEILTGIAG